MDGLDERMAVVETELQGLYDDVERIDRTVERALEQMSTHLRWQIGLLATILLTLCGILVSLA
jgi:hypothetical protein